MIFNRIAHRIFKPFNRKSCSQLILGAILAMCITACSDDEPDADAKLQFSAFITENSAQSSRASVLYASDNTMFPSMLVSAVFDDGTSYFHADEFTLQGNVWRAKGGDRFWPTIPLQFYGVAPAGSDVSGRFQQVENRFKIVDFSVNTDVTKQTDLLVAYSAPFEKSKTSVMLQFRHALSQITFRASNTSSKMHAVVYGISLCNVPSKATFTFPQADADHHSGSDLALTHENWSGISSPSNFHVNFSSTPVAVSSKDADSQRLTDGHADRSLLMLPQSVPAWTHTLTTGAYVLVNCTIYNIADADKGYQSGKDIPLWGDNNSPKQILIPIAIDWQPGVRYNYVIEFGEGSNCIDPANPEQPVLKPMSYSFTCEPWVDKTVDIEI